jgi:hypothetical protein
MANGNSYTPFVDMPSFVREEGEVPVTPPSGGAPWSPFLSVYEQIEGEAPFEDPVREAYVSVVQELYDEEFDESLFELLTDARNLHSDHLGSGHSQEDADRLVAQHFSDLIRESESAIDTMAREFGSRDDERVQQEIESFAEQYAGPSTLEPAFEDFLGKLLKKVAKGVKAVAGKAVQGIAKIGLGPILSKIKALIRPLLNRVMQKAIGRLPVAVQPIARKLAERLGLAPKAAPAPPPAPSAPEPATAADAAVAGADAGALAAAQTPAAAIPDDPGTPIAAEAGPDVTEMQTELDEQIAEALLADDAQELELEIARARSAPSSSSPVFTNLDQARERFINDLQQLKEGESPAPYIENFLPAVLPVLRIALRLIGRPKVVNFLAGLLGKLISNLVGPAQAPALSRAIVDAGLKLVSLEASDEGEARLAPAAVAATVEETVSRVASLPDHVLEDQELLEAFTLDAFEQSAAANLPAVFSQATYRKRPDLLEGGVNATWVMLPLRRPRYKRCSRTFNVKISPYMAEAVESFEDTPLSEYLQDQLAIAEGEDVEAEVHLYEILPGGTAGDIARSESETIGLGASDEATLSQLQPLTQEAAGVLLRAPGLGRKLPPGANIRTVMGGQRLYHLAIPNRRPLTARGRRGRSRVRRLARVYATLDHTQDLIRICIFLSEVKAQRLAVRLRQQSHAGSLTVGFHKLLSRRLPPILHGKRRKRLKIVHTAVPPGSASDSYLGRLPTIVPPAFVTRLQEWLVQAFAEFVKTQSQKFISAAEDPADGVTLEFIIEHPPGLKELGQALAEKGASGAQIAETVAKGGRPTVRVEAHSGHKCG